MLTLPSFFDVSATYSYQQLTTTSTNSLDTKAATQLLVDAAKGCADIQPDLFYFNFNGYTGQLLFDWQHQLVVSSSKDIRVKPIFTNKQLTSWQITTVDGTVYVFAAAEYTTTKPKTFNVTNCTPATGNTFISSWYLSSVTDVNREHNLDFQYEGYTLNYGLRFTDALENAIGNCPDLRDEGVDRSSQGYSLMSGLRLRRIQASSGVDTTAKIDLIPAITLRSDTLGVTSSNRSNLRALDRLVVRDGAGQEVRTVYLSYYADNPTGRLTLWRVQQGRLSGSKLPGHVFSYNTRFSLPGDIRSRAQDHWGFYNGATQNDVMRSLVPGCTLPGLYGRVIKRDGADREVHPTYAQAGILTRVQYPTGGYSVYDYESNEYSYVNNIKLEYFNQHTTKRYDYTAASYGGANNLKPNACNDEVVYFTVTPKKNVQSPTTGTNFSFPQDPRVLVHLTGQAHSAGYDKGNRPFAELDSLNGQRLKWTGTADYTNSDRSFDAYVPLYPGQYSLRAHACNYRADGSNGYDSAEMSVSFDNDGDVVVKKLAGGLRVKRIRDYVAPGDSAYTEKVFAYTEATVQDGSSGCIYGEPHYEYLSTYMWEDFNQAKPESSRGAPTICDYWLRMARNRSSLGTTQGSFIGYREVTVTNQLQHQPYSRSIYRFSSPVEYPDTLYDEVPFAPARSFGHRTGQLLSQTDYQLRNTKWAVVRQTNTTYQFYETQSPGLAVANPNALGVGQGGIVGYIQFFRKAFVTQFGYAQPAGTTESLYEAASQQVHTLRQAFHYNAAGTRVVTQQKEVARDDQEVTHLSYAPDYQQPAGSLYALMASSLHVLDPIETVTTRLQANRAVVVGATHQDYGLRAGKLRLLAGRKLAIAMPLDTSLYQYSVRTPGNTPDGRLERRVIIDRYDAAGNVTQLHQPAGKPVARLWGYGRAYLLAEVQNATYEDLVSVLGQAVVDELAGLRPGTAAEVQRKLRPLRSQLPQAQVVTFSHQPLVGISSQMDASGHLTTYEYDEFNRLVRTRDEQGRILSQQQYHYAGK